MSSVERVARTDQIEQVQVWDLPARLAHWLLALAVVGCFGTAEYGWLSMQWHFYFGYAVIVLVLFRILWGFFGTEHARFSRFLRGPGAVWAYLKGLTDKSAPQSIGHSAVGGWAVVALLLASLAQGVSGLFNSDDIFWFGPLNEVASAGLVDKMADFHERFYTVLLLLIGLHVLAACLYLLVKKQNLILPMLSGNKRKQDIAPAELAANPPVRLSLAALWLRAAVLLALSAGMLWALTRFWPTA